MFFAPVIAALADGNVEVAMQYYRARASVGQAIDPLRFIQACARPEFDRPREDGRRDLHEQFGGIVWALRHWAVPHVSLTGHEEAIAAAFGPGTGATQAGFHALMALGTFDPVDTQLIMPRLRYLMRPSTALSTPRVPFELLRPVYDARGKITGYTPDW